jgi:hypothetical protein
VRKASFCSPAVAGPAGAPVGAARPPVTGTCVALPSGPVSQIRNEGDTCTLVMVKIAIGSIKILVDEQLFWGFIMIMLSKEKILGNPTVFLFLVTLVSVKINIDQRNAKTKNWLIRRNFFAYFLANYIS